MKVINGEVHCPKDSEVLLKNCFAPPGKDILLKKVLKAAKDKQIELGINEKHIPDKKWLVMILA